jgi:predicted metal-dependent phosphotriesterase family hydrolase
LKTIKELIDSGYENKLMLGHDWAIAMPIFAENLIKSRDEYNPYGYEFIRKIVIPELLRIGVTERVIQAFMVINPSKFLTGEH